MAYANLDQLIADYIPGATKQAEVDAIERVLDNVSAFVDTYCRRTAGFFNPSAEEPSIKRVRGEGSHFLRLPVHVFGSITSVKRGNSTTAIDSSSYYESDKNGWLYIEEDSIYPETSFGCSENWIDGAIYKVTARWGYAATPADLQEAVRQLVVKIWETQHGVLGTETPSGFIIERAMPPLVREVLDRYKKRQFEI